MNEIIPALALAAAEASTPSRAPSGQAYTDVSAAAREAAKEIDELRRKNGEIARDRDAWKLRAEKAEAASDGEALRTLARGRDSAAKQLAIAQRRVAELEKERKECADLVEASAKGHAIAEHELDTARANLEHAFAARDKVKAQLAITAGDLAALKATDAEINTAYMAAHKRATESGQLVDAIRKAMDASDAKATFWAIFKLLNPKSGVTPATEPTGKAAAR